MTCNVWKQESERSEDEVKDFFLKLFLQPYPAKAFIPGKESQTDFGMALWEAEEDDHQVMFEMFKIFKMYKVLRRGNNVYLDRLSDKAVARLIWAANLSTMTCLQVLQFNT